MIEGAIALLKSRKPADLQAGSATLLKIGAAAVPALVDAAVNDDWELQDIDATADDDWKLHSQAIQVLARMDAESLRKGRAVSRLVEALTDPESTARARSAAWTLAELGPRAAEAIPALKKAMASPDSHPDVRLASASALGEIGSETPGVAPDLIDFALLQIEARSPTDRALRRTFFEKIGAPAIPAVVAATLDDDQELRDEAHHVLKIMGQEAVRKGGAVPLLVKALADRDEATRARAAECLAALGPGASEAVPALVAALTDESPAVRRAAAFAAGKLGSKSVVPLLIEAITDRDEAARSQAAECLAALGPGASEAVPALVAALKHPDRKVRSSAAWVLGQIGPETAIEPLLQALNDDPDKWVRRASASSLKFVEPRPAKVVDALLNALQDDFEEVRAVAIESLQRSMPKRAIPLVIERLEDPSPQVRLAASHALTDPSNRHTVAPALDHAIKSHENKRVRISAVDALGLLLETERTYRGMSVLQGPDAVTDLGPFLAAFDDPDAEVRQYAIAVVGPLGWRDPDFVVPPLIAALGDPAAPRREGAAQALMQILTPTQEALVGEPIIPSIPTVAEAAARATTLAINGLDDRDGAVRQALESVLVDASPRSPEVAAAVRQASDDPRPRVRQSVKSVLERLAPTDNR
jgi:HEAT repeat protein